MPQVIHTKDFGDILIEKAWVNGTMGIGVTPSGAYVHLSGLAVNSREEFEAVHMNAEELADACYWLDHRHDIEEEAPKRIVFNPDGSYEFEDGTPINSITELIDAMGQGNPALEAACLWFSQETLRRQDKAVRDATEIGGMARKVAEQATEEKVNAAPPAPAPRKKAVPKKKAAPPRRNAPQPAAEITV